MAEHSDEERRFKARQRQIARLREKRRAGRPLDMYGHPESCICYDCLWGEHREMREEAMLERTVPIVERPCKRGRFHPPG